jgi:ABC-type phosphate transport system substrate-binding protein
MKLVKYLVVLTFALCAFATKSNAQTIQFLGGGSSALFLELGQAAQGSGLTATPCVWSKKKDTTNILARDNRPATAVDEAGDIWVTWNANGGTCAAPTVSASLNIYSYMKLDSVVGDKCYFETESSGVSGCQQILTVAASTAPDGLILAAASETAIPGSIITALHLKHFNAIGTDIRPEDAKFATFRMFANCDSPVFRQAFDQGLRQVFGLGYAGTVTGVGKQVLSDFSSALFNVLDFNVTGNDPITGKVVPGYAVTTIGAQPIIVAVAPATGTGMGSVTDINGVTLTQFYDGVLGRTSDLFGPTVSNPVTTLVREPLSGTYNTFEYSIPNTSQFHQSQDDFNCSGTSVNLTKMHLQGTNGAVASFRRRVIGTGEMTTQLQTLGLAGTDTIGYFFWSAKNGSALPNVKYVTVNGVDPIQDSYTGGVIPGNGGVPLTNVTFKWLNLGDYPIWSALRLVSATPAPSGVTNLASAAQTAAATAADMIPLSKLNVWHSHYYLPAINIGVAANGNTVNTASDLCATGIVESGGDAGGGNLYIKANKQFCADFSNITGIINKDN